MFIKTFSVRVKVRVGVRIDDRLRVRARIRVRVRVRLLFKKKFVRFFYNIGVTTLSLVHRKAHGLKSDLRVLQKPRGYNRCLRNRSTGFDPSSRQTF